MIYDPDRTASSQWYLKLLAYTVSWTLIVKTHQNQHRRTNKHPWEGDLYDKWRREQDLSDKRIGKVDLAEVLDTLITIESIELRAVLS